MKPAGDERSRRSQERACGKGDGSAVDECFGYGNRSPRSLVDTFSCSHWRDIVHRGHLLRDGEKAVVVVFDNFVDVAAVVGKI